MATTSLLCIQVSSKIRRAILRLYVAPARAQAR